MIKRIFDNIVYGLLVVVLGINYLFDKLDEIE